MFKIQYWEDAEEFEAVIDTVELAILLARITTQTLEAELPAFSLKVELVRDAPK